MKKLMAANWKMYKTWDDAKSTAQELVKLAADKLPNDREVLIFPPFTALKAVADVMDGVKGGNMRTSRSFGSLSATSLTNS